jgi:threonine dehydrogenase-like Zn-dependent dehydrogenase
MQALVYTAPLEMKVLSVDPPEPAPGQTIIRVAAAGICGSEIEGFVNRSPFRVPPLIMGHEFSGYTPDGTLVTVNPLVTCGVCDMCSRGMPNVCRVREILGIQRPGGFAEFVSVPTHRVVPLPAGTSVMQGAFVEPTANGVHALRLIREHDPLPVRIGVIGIGPLGYAVLAAAKAGGTPQIAAADGYAPRRAWAERLGIEEVGERLTGEFDAIVDTVGTAGTRAESVALVRPGGTAVWMGLHGPEDSVDGQAMIRTEKRIITSFCYSAADYTAAIHIVGGLDEAWGETASLADGVEAFTGLTRGPVESLKTFLLP